MPRALWDQRVAPQHAWTINSLWLLKYEAVITSSQSVAHLLKPSLDAFVTSAYYRELKYLHSKNGFENVVYKMITWIKEYTTTQFLYKHTLFNTLKSRQIACIWNALCWKKSSCWVRKRFGNEKTTSHYRKQNGLINRLNRVFMHR